MFIRLLHDVTKDGVTTTHETLFEGNEVKFYPQKDDDELIMRVAGKDGEIDVGIKKSAAELYIVNNEGRTIDSYTWKQSQ